VDDGVGVRIERCQHRLAVDDVASHKAMPVGVESSQVVEVASIGERIKIGDGADWHFRQRQPDEGRSDKPCSAGDEEILHDAALS
jgi:hypothetical protein